ncbi:hypothetical protein QP166_18035 [Sphingomonas sp. LR60]
MQIAERMQFGRRSRPPPNAAAVPIGVPESSPASVEERLLTIYVH